MVSCTGGARVVVVTPPPTVITVGIGIGVHLDAVGNGGRRKEHGNEHEIVCGPCQKSPAIYKRSSVVSSPGVYVLLSIALAGILKSNGKVVPAAMMTSSSRAIPGRINSSVDVGDRLRGDKSRPKYQTSW